MVEDGGRGGRDGRVVIVGRSRGAENDNFGSGWWVKGVGEFSNLGLEGERSETKGTSRGREKGQFSSSTESCPSPRVRQREAKKKVQT